MNNETTQESKVPVKAYSKGELKDLYGVSHYTLRVWLKPFIDDIGIIAGGMYTPKQIEIIFSKIGNPSE